MRFQFKIIGRRLVLDYGFKEPDFVSRKEVKQYAEVDQLSKKLIRLNRKMVKYSRRYGLTEFYERGLTELDIAVLERKGFKVRCRTKTLRDNKIKLIRDQFVITV